jgi:plastocyanin
VKRSRAFPSAVLSGLGVLIALAAPAVAWAGSLAATVNDHDGEAVKDAVVLATPLGGGSSNGKRTAVIDQIDKEYVPHVTAVRVGTEVTFPNKDQIRHHVYSFSDAKTFEIPLYKGTPAAPVLFDKAGVVVLGCNIHDWMKAYVYVTETPYFGVTGGDGKVTLKGVPAGQYRVEVWHPTMKGDPDDHAQQVSVGASGGSASFQIEQKKVWRPRRGPRGGGGDY